MTDVCEVVEALKENFVAGEVAFGEAADDIEGGIPGERGESFQLAGAKVDEMAAGEKEHRFVLRSGETGVGRKSRNGEIDDEADEGGDGEVMEVVGEEVVEQCEMAEDELEGGGRQLGGKIGKAGDRSEEFAMEGVEERSVVAGGVEKLGDGAGSSEEDVSGSGG